MIEAVLFDLDGLVLDTEPIIMQACDYMGERMGVGKAGHLIPKTIGMNSEESNQYFRRVFGSRYDIKASYDYFHEFINRYNKTHPGVPVKCGIRTLLRWLKAREYRMGVATCKSIGYANQYLGLGGILDCFEIIVGEDYFDEDAQVDAFTMACRKMGVLPGNTIVLEDSPSGIATAHRAGMVPIMVPDLVQPDSKTEKMLYAKCNSLFDVIDVIRRLDGDAG